MFLLSTQHPHAVAVVFPEYSSNSPTGAGKQPSANQQDAVPTRGPQLVLHQVHNPPLQGALRFHRLPLRLPLVPTIQTVSPGMCTSAAAGPPG